jgi:hypothetical protein
VKASGSSQTESLELERVSSEVRFRPWGAENEPDPWRSLYGAMFVQDITNHVFPIGGHLRAGEAPTWALDAPNENQKKMALGAFAFRASDAWDTRDVSHVMCQWGTRCVQDILLWGTSLHEVAFWRSKSNRTLVGFAVLPLRHLGVSKRILGYRQRIPKTEATEPRSITLPKDLVVAIRTPRGFGDVPGTVRMLSKLAGTLPEFALRNMTSVGSDRLNIDMGVLRDTENLAVSEAVHRIGWDMRSLTGDAETAYYSAERRLRFETFKASLRESVLAGANAILDRARSRLGIEVTAQIKNMAVQTTIDAAKARLRAGQITQHELISQFDFY